jgi:inosine/xanthosine triphosphate pyrophosphatase family protein
VIGVLKDNHKARKVYEKWGGKLDNHEQPFVKLGVGYDEVFYTYEL